MENRWSHLFEFEFKEVQKPMLTVQMNPNERLLRIVLEIPDESGLLEEEDLLDEFDGEAFVEHALVVREREFETFTRVLHYNNMRYRVEPLTIQTVKVDE
jgi:hypothetical protein